VKQCVAGTRENFPPAGTCCIHTWICTRCILLQSNNVIVYDNALEFLENVLNSQLRGVLVPLLDGKVSQRESGDRRASGARKSGESGTSCCRTSCER
jgi:hypothetical protein